MSKIKPQLRNRLLSNTLDILITYCDDFHVDIVGEGNKTVFDFGGK